MKALSILTACAALLTGCTSFEPLRSTRFVDDNNNYLHVDYGRDTNFTAYQNMAPTGNLYKTEDGEWEFFESGAGCIVARFVKERSGYVTRFRGTLCATVRNPANATRSRLRTGGSTPSGFGRDANGPRDVTNEKN